MQWNEENILELATSTATIRRGKSLASSSKWQLLATDYALIWGECLGSGQNTYRVQVELQTASFRCNCPVRALPCKHILGLLLLYAKSSANFKYLPPPDWLSLSQNTTEKHLAKAKTSNSPKTADALEKTRIAKEKRWQKRLNLMQNGLNELELWLEDMLRQGIANLEVENASFWCKIAAKMVDAKLPRLSSYLKETHLLIANSEEWLSPLVARLGELYLWIEAFRNQDKLPLSLQQELFSSLGKTTNKTAVLATNPPQNDQWLVLSVWESVDIEGRNFRKVWLRGLETEQYALFLDYSFGNMDYEEQYILGSTIIGSLVFYAPAYPQRAVWSSQQSIKKTLDFNLKSYSNFDDLLEEYSLALAANPWFYSWPVLLEVRPIYQPQNLKLQLIDSAQNCLEITELEEEYFWQILAISGGNPLLIFGEWNGSKFLPISLIDEHNELIPLG